VTGLDARTESKRVVGFAAVDRYVRPGMRIGLGTGSTAVWAIRRVGELLAGGTLTDVAAVPTSDASAQEARACGVPLTTLDEHPRLAVTIDGADEVSPTLDLIKGGGGAHLREKVVAQASDRLVIVVDAAKLVPALGTTFAVPVEVITMAQRPEHDYLESLGATVTLRRTADGAPFVTDEGNRILDAAFGPIDDPRALLGRLQQRAGVVEVGLFLDMASVVLVAGTADTSGSQAGAAAVRELTRGS
jgi:ribose 5-phosphate isomerase A